MVKLPKLIYMNIFYNVNSIIYYIYLFVYKGYLSFNSWLFKLNIHYLYYKFTQLKEKKRIKDKRWFRYLKQISSYPIILVSFCVYFIILWAYKFWNIV